MLNVAEKGYFAFCRYNGNCEHQVLLTPINRMDQYVRQKMLKIIEIGPFIIPTCRYNKSEHKKYIGCTIHNEYNGSYEPIELIEYWENKEIFDCDVYHHIDDKEFSISPYDLYQIIMEQNFYANKNIIACVIVTELSTCEKPFVLDYCIDNIEMKQSNIEQLLSWDERIARIKISNDCISKGKVVLFHKKYKDELLNIRTNINGLSITFYKQ